MHANMGHTCGGRAYICRSNHILFACLHAQNMQAILMHLFSMQLMHANHIHACKTRACLQTTCMHANHAHAHMAPHLDNADAAGSIHELANDIISVIQCSLACTGCEVVVCAVPDVQLVDLRYSTMRYKGRVWCDVLIEGSVARASTVGLGAQSIAIHTLHITYSHAHNIDMTCT